MSKVTSEKSIHIKTRSEVRNWILNSGLFKIEIKNGVHIPRGVYRLDKRDKNLLSDKIIPVTKLRYFLCSLELILFSYHKQNNLNVNNKIEEFADDELKDIKKSLAEIGLDELEIKRFFPALEKPRFKNLIKKKLSETGAFEKTLERSQMYYKLYMPLINAFQKYIYPNIKTKDVIIHHMAHLLINCKVIDQTDSEKAYQKIKKDIYRVRSHRN